MSTARRGKASGDAAAAQAAGPRILKKYPNRRLYDTQTSTYITLADVKRMVLEGIEFEVHDAKSHEDLTRSILLQIILEEETGGVPMFSTNSLAQIIRFYGHAMQGAMGGLLDKQMQAFAEMQQRFAQQPTGMPFTPDVWSQMMGGMTEQSKTLMNQWQDQFKLFPFGPKKP
jgi:polyhydroxyalkanoate synthesis repressor PhaR